MPKITIEITGCGGELAIGTVRKDLFEKIEDYAYVRNLEVSDVFSVWEDLFDATDQEICNWYDIDDKVHVQGPILGGSELTLKIDGQTVVNHVSTSKFNTTFSEDYVKFDYKDIYIKSMNEEQGEFMVLQFEADNSFELSKLVLTCDRVGYGTDELEFDCFITGVEYDGEPLDYVFENDVDTKGFSIDIFNPYYDEEQDISEL